MIGGDAPKPALGPEVWVTLGLGCDGNTQTQQLSQPLPLPLPSPWTPLALPCEALTLMPRSPAPKEGLGSREHRMANTGPGPLLPSLSERLTQGSSLPTSADPSDRAWDSPQGLGPRPRTLTLGGAPPRGPICEAGVRAGGTRGGRVPRRLPDYPKPGRVPDRESNPRPFGAWVPPHPCAAGRDVRAFLL